MCVLLLDPSARARHSSLTTATTHTTRPLRSGQSATVISYVYLKFGVQYGQYKEFTTGLFVDLAWLFEGLAGALAQVRLKLLLARSLPRSQLSGLTRYPLSLAHGSSISSRRPTACRSATSCC